MTCLNVPELKNALLYLCDSIIAEKDYLTRVDSAIGDGDHGIGMALGFEAAHRTLSEKEYMTVNDIFTAVGMSLLKTMGGASGVIFGTMFFAGVKGIPEIRKLDTNNLSVIFSNSLDAIKKRGGASIGDKTMIDALEPAVYELRKSASMGEEISAALQKAVQAAKEGMENTKGLVAVFGKAKALGERAIGHQDAGATSVYLIFKALSEWTISNRSDC